MIDLFSLGELYISSFIPQDVKPLDSRKHELKLVMEEDTRAVKLETPAPKEMMFGQYWYKSGLNETMRQELKNIVDSILPLMSFKENQIWADAASNDGTLLSFVPDSFIKIGIDPIEDKFKEEAERHADLIIQDYFSANVFKKSKFGNQKIFILTSIAVFYDLDNPDEFCKDAYDVLDDEGLWIMQLSHSGLMIHQLAFDNILSEHRYYYSLSSLKIILERNGFSVVDCSLNDTNGGSFRVYIRKKTANEKLFATQPYRDVCKFRIESLLAYERVFLKLEEPATWLMFYDKVVELRNQVRKFIKEEKAKGKTFWGYSASTKGNTALQYFKLDHTMIDGIAERSIDKWGLKTIGTNIPIYPEDKLRKEKPDYVIVLAWHFIGNFLEREKELLDAGTKFIVTMPVFEIIGK